MARWNLLMFQFVLIASMALFLTACETNPPAPVVDRLPQSSKPAAPGSANNTNASKTNAANKTGTAKDWRPDSYTGKKGDTLFSIGLEYGLDYKEIASANNITDPYPIHIGQKLNLASVKAKTDGASQAGVPSEDGVVITPIKTDSVVEATTTPSKETPNSATEAKPTQSNVPPILTEPKAIREPYSAEAFNRTTTVKITETKVAIPAKPSEVKGVENKPSEIKAGEVKPADATKTDDEAITWSWPTQGKVVAAFNEATNKGLDISGTSGQAINAASGGKVIYSGSDLRGYGKLVIIKHNKTYLSVYAHNSKIIAKEGQIVVAGQKIAEMGNTDSNTVKLHFEIRRLGKSVDPARYLNQN